jgi:hypothetical protein
MREYLMAVALCVALSGCDNKPESGMHDGGAKTDAAKSEGGKPAETKSEGSKSTAAKHSWGSFKVGSMSKLKSVSEMEVAGNKMKTEMTMTYTLKSVTVEEAVVDVETVIPNVPPQKTEQKHLLKAPQTKASGDAPQVKTGTEEIEVAGKKLKCTTSEVDTDANGMKTTMKTWMCDEVPGHLVKSVSKMSGASSGTTTTELLEFAVK